MKAYHLDLAPEATGGARFAFLPGDPGRVPGIARAFDAEAREVASKREYRSFAGSMEGHPVLVTSTGIGGPSTSIAVEELAHLGVRTFLRVGTTGGIRDELALGDVVITTGAVRFDGASSEYAPPEFPAVAHHEVVEALVAGARTEEVRYHVGITASTDTFHPGQERSGSYGGGLLHRLQGRTEELRRLGVLNYEMEAATLLTMGAALGLRAGCVTGVVADRTRSEAVHPEALAEGERNAVRVAVRGMRLLLQ